MEKKLGKKQNGQVSSQIISPEIIQNKIYLVRGEKVMTDKDLAILYGVSTRRLKEQVRRNLKRFPSDFLIELKIREAKGLFSRSQIATTSSL